jgi:hypothetical protein
MRSGCAHLRACASAIGVLVMLVVRPYWRECDGQRIDHSHRQDSGIVRCAQAARRFSSLRFDRQRADTKEPALIAMEMN